MVDFLKFRASDSESAARLAPPAPRASACRRRTRAAHAATGFKFPERIPADREGAGSEPRPFTLSGSQEPRTPPPPPEKKKEKNLSHPKKKTNQDLILRPFPTQGVPPFRFPRFKVGGGRGRGRREPQTLPRPRGSAPRQASGTAEPLQAPGTVVRKSPAKRPELLMSGPTKL